VTSIWDSSEKKVSCAIWGFRRGANEIPVILGCYVALICI